MAEKQPNSSAQSDNAGLAIRGLQARKCTETAINAGLVLPGLITAGAAHSCITQH